MTDVVLASCRELPEPDPDEAPLLGALRERDLSAEAWAWDDESIDWSQARLVLLRSTWNYYLDRDRFLAWCSRVDQVTSLHNPLSVVRWNTHKRYLIELAEAGVSVVPTRLVPKGSDVELADVCAETGWDKVVVKPAVAAASYNAYVALAEDHGAMFRADVNERETLVQPYVESVEAHGERSVVVIDGEITHSVRKEPRFADDAEKVSGPHPVADDEAALVRAALAQIPHDGSLLYSRVDMVRDDAGAPMISELELSEPSLFFPYSDEALARMVSGIETLLG